MARWDGIDYNERRIRGVQNMLVDVHLWGVTGVSPDRGFPHKMVSAAKADDYLRRGRDVYAALIVQSPPRGARTWFEHESKKLGDLLKKAEAVRAGRVPQKMTRADYAEYRRSLGLRA